MIINPSFQVLIDNIFYAAKPKKISSIFCSVFPPYLIFLLPKAAQKVAIGQQ